MKNLSIPATVRVNSATKVKSEFRIHDGKLFWHGCPRIMAQPEHDKYIFPKNACLGECVTMTNDTILDMVAKHFGANGYDASELSIEFGEPKMVAERKKRTATATKPEPIAEPAPMPETSTEPETATAPEVMAEPENEPAPAPIAEPISEPTTEPAPMTDVENNEPASDIDTDAFQLVQLLARLKGTKVDEKMVAKVVRQEIARLMSNEPETITEAVIQAASLEEEIKTPEFDAIVADVKDGFYPYLEGAAGCGKSYTAEQVSRACNLKFYPMQQILFAHQVEGYGDAAGRYVPTPVYEAFCEGGLVFLDEFDSSSPEAALVINNMLANGEYTFPVVGHKKAHPKFRVIFAGNTCGKGADEEYTGRSVLDGSTRDRIIDYKMSYDRRVEMMIANNDAETVDFIEDLRKAVEKTGIRHIVSYRATKYAVARKNDRENALRRGVVKFLEKDEMRLLYQNLENKECAWAMAFKAIIK